MCDPVKKLPKCRYFRDITWTLVSGGNSTQQIVHCHCPRGSVAYLVKRQVLADPDPLDEQLGDDVGDQRFKYSFACSPQSVSKAQDLEKTKVLST